MENPWKTLKSTVVYENPWIVVHEDTVIRPDGTKGMYSVVDTVGSAAVFIVALTDHEQILLIGQFRYPTAMYSWELPGGGTGGKDPLEAAKLELQEETGYVAKEWQKIGTLQSMNGISSEIEHVFIAQGLTKTSEHKQAEEGITASKLVSIREALRMISSGDINDAQTIAALSIALLYLKGTQFGL